MVSLSSDYFYKALLTGLLGKLKHGSFTCLFVSGSFVVLNSETMEEMASFHHRKEEISDIKFSPGMFTVDDVMTKPHPG